MEFPPDEWAIFSEEDFLVAVPRDPGEIGMEVMAQIRPTGRILDHFRIVLGGSKLLETALSTKDMFPGATLPAFNISYQKWPRDIELRPNMATSEWMDVKLLIASNDMTVEPSAGSSSEAAETTPANADLLAALEGSEHAASIRWAVGVGADNCMELALQLLPAAAAILSGKPALRG